MQPPNDRPIEGPNTVRLEDLLDQTVGLCLAHWAALPDEPAYRKAPEALLARMAASRLPQVSSTVETWKEHLAKEIMAYPMGVGHPRWWAFMHSSAHPAGVAAELIAAVLNNNCWAPDQVATQLELLVIDWLRELVGLPAGFDGIMTTGGTMANLYALAAARSWRLPHVRETGVGDSSVRVYASQDVHVSVPAALELLGIGRSGLCQIPTDSNGRMDVGSLEAAISVDLADGRMPLAVVGTAGTVTSGIIDPLASIAEVAKAHSLWFHVDGALGAFANSLPEFAGSLAGIEQADSVTADPHKWLYVPFGAGAVLVRNASLLEAAFASATDYLGSAGGVLSSDVRFVDRGFELTRSFRALKVWSVIQLEGLEGLRRLWRKDLAIAAEIRRRVDRHPRLEPLGKTDLNVFCFRYRCKSDDSDAFQLRLLEEVVRDGRSFVGPVKVNGRWGLRGCVCNHRSNQSDVDLFVNSVVEIADRLDVVERKNRGGIAPC